MNEKILNGRNYVFDELKEFIIDATTEPTLQAIYKKKGRRGYKLYNVACSFDTETTNTEINGNKIAFMYIWSFNLNGVTIVGRTWEQFLKLLNELKVRLDLSSSLRLVVYVQNLSYEFQFMRKYFTWLKVFTHSDRKPIFAVCSQGIEFRDSWILSNSSLERMSNNLSTYKISKKVGQLDYSLIRHSETVMSEQELEYVRDDVRCLSAYIQETMEYNGDITKIPYTKTGYVRRYVKNACLNPSNYRNYRDLMDELTLNPDEYVLLKKAFTGGFNHGNVAYVEEIIENVTSYDESSAYISAMLSEMYPMSKGKRITITSKDEFMHYCRTYCCVFTIIMKDIKLKSYMPDCPISLSKCEHTKNVELDNGRIRSADYIEITITEQDFIIFSRFYSFQFKVKDNELIYYRKGYLPRPILECCIKLYKDKTELKDVLGREIDYVQTKSMLLSVYGMMVMDVVKETYDYSDRWNTIHPDLQTQIEQYNKSKNRFTFYPWGIWTSAYARRNLFMGIYDCRGNENNPRGDYVYSDTDCIKIINASQHQNFIDGYNKHIQEKIEQCLLYNKFDVNACRPSTINGKVIPLGIYRCDGKYARFKTLGAKRYLVEKEDGTLELTCSGLNKKTGIDYLLQLDYPFLEFQDHLVIPKEHSGKLTYTYCDDCCRGEIADYDGVISTFESLSYVHMSQSEFDISLTQEYLDLLFNIKTVYGIL